LPLARAAAAISEISNPRMSLSLHNITCARGDRVLFSGLTLDVARGEALLVRGANGSGKSSLLRLIAGLLRPADGQVDWAEPDGDATLQTQLHYLGHLDALKAAMSVGETLTFWARMLGGKADTSAAVEAWHLETLLDLPCGVLSAGQRRRVALAQLNLTDRPLWLLDEPTGPLDKAGVELVERAIRHHCGAGGIAVIATHRAMDVGEARTLDLGPGRAGE
jgi:heme exporter protein A